MREKGQGDRGRGGGCRCSLALLVQEYLLIGTKVQILIPGDAAFIPPPRQNAIFVPLSGGREVFV